MDDLSEIKPLRLHFQSDGQGFSGDHASVYNVAVSIDIWVCSVYS